MKRYPGLLICMLMGLVLMAGCGDNSSISSGGSEKNTGKTVSGSSAESSDWKPTLYETVNDLDGVVMTVKKETVSCTGLTVVFANSSKQQGIYGEYFCLEKKINGKWYQMPVIIDNYGFDDIGYELAAGDNREWTVEWDWLYGSLNAGEYRIVKDVLKLRSPGDHDTFYLAAEFAVS